MNRIYLDNAATSWPKPEIVYRTVDSMQRNLGAPLGRGSYDQAHQVSRLVERTRDRLARLIGATDRKQIAFTFSCTDALNMAIQGLQLENGHVVTSVTEHNSVLRQLRDLEDRKTIEISRVECDQHGFIDIAGVLNAIRPETKLVALSQVSNVTGTIQNLKPVGQRCRQLAIPFLVDAAQSIGHIPVDVNELQCDLLAASGHKGLLAPLGTGFLYYSESIAHFLRPLRLGGTGSSAGEDRQPDTLPDKFEAGNINVPGIAGIGAGIEFLESDEGQSRNVNYRRLTQQLVASLPSIPKIKLFGPTDPTARIGVFSLAMENYSAHELAALLDSNFSIQTRAGFHCAPLMHTALGSDKIGGLLRISLGPFSNQQDIDSLLTALNNLAQSD